MEFKYTHNKISLLNLFVVIPRKNCSREC